MSKLTPATKGQISWIVGNYHVGKSDDEVRENWQMRIARNNRRNKSHKIDDELRTAIIAYALECHHNNQGLYHAVMTGNFVPAFGEN